MTPEDLRKAAAFIQPRNHAAESLEWNEAVRLAAGLRAMADAEPVRLQCVTCGTVYAEGVPPQVAQQRPQWVGLTELEIAEGVTENRCGLTSGQFSDVAFMKGARFAEKAMRAKNGGA